uniref:Uncharacterized protein n=1 Tax=uncultured marine thaumarchaeote AD1000_88_E07 TaxID=1455946 RepID=A0A075G5A6_9ARCH|nr:hypothetical protein [uncultured marine thaumarchaeote AD1000_88_E07]
MCFLTIMQYTEEQIRDMVKLKETIIEKLSKYEEEIGFLQKTLDILDVTLKNSSFTKASDLPKNNFVEKLDETNLQETDQIIQIKKNKDGKIIANATVTPEQVSIVLEDNIGLTEEIAPLRSFFVERIIGGMKKSDDKLVENGEINEESVINCIINKNGSSIREIIIKNYREKNRVDEIISTATWSLTRMIENSTK